MAKPWRCGEENQVLVLVWVQRFQIVRLPDSLVASRDLLAHGRRCSETWQQTEARGVPEFSIAQQSAQLRGEQAGGLRHDRNT